MSTLGGWTLIICVAGYYAFRITGDRRRREAAKAAKQRLDDRHAQNRKEPKEKAKRQRGESYTKEIEGSDKSTKQRLAATAQKPVATTPNQKVDYSSDDGADNREFAKQLASIKQGTSFNGPKKSDEKKQKSVKQSRAQERDNVPASKGKVSAPSSTTGADADDDQSPIASPEFTAVDANDVSDMLERPSSTGPSVLRLTDTDKAPKKKEKKAKAPEPTETKKQRQNKAKVEAARLAREAEEAERKVKMEAQRRLARISEGRAAKDGSSFTAASQPKNNAWAANGANGTSDNNGEFIPVQPLDTFDTTVQTDVSKSSGPSVGKSETWMSSLPSEEEQMSLLRDNENWSTVKTKKSQRKHKDTVTSDSNSVSNDNSSVTSSVTKPQKVMPVVSAPVVAKSQQTKTKPGSNGRPTGTFAQQSSFAALSGNDGPEEEEEWDV